MIKDEHPYIREWALYHKNLGFNQIILYDDSSSHSYEKELGDLIKDNFITLIIDGMTLLLVDSLVQVAQKNYYQKQT